MKHPYRNLIALSIVFILIAVVGAVSGIAYIRNFITSQSPETTHDLILKNFYYLEITRKPNSPKPDSNHLGLYVANLLDLPQVFKENLAFGLGGLYYDTRKGDPHARDKFESFNYYLLLFRDKDDLPRYTDPKKIYIDTTKTYEDASMLVHVSKANPELLPYIVDTKNDLSVSGHCQVDSDCVLRYEYCNSFYGAHNYYQSFLEDIKCNEQEAQTINQYKGVRCISNFCSVIE